MLYIYRSISICSYIIKYFYLSPFYYLVYDSALILAFCIIENIFFFHPSILSNKKYIHFCVLTCKSKKEYWDVGKIIISYLMGCSQIKDPNLDIYMEVDKQFYMGGDMVRGCVHINAKSDSMYEKLVVRLEG